MAVNQQAATLVHELAHALVRADRQADDPELDYATEELVAESVAFTVVRSLGIDADARTIPYLASWAEASDITAIEKVAALIDRLARRIEAGLDTHDDDSSEAAEVGERAAAWTQRSGWGCDVKGGCSSTRTQNHLPHPNHKSGHPGDVRAVVL